MRSATAAGSVRTFLRHTTPLTEPRADHTREYQARHFTGYVSAPNEGASRPVLNMSLPVLMDGALGHGSETDEARFDLAVRTNHPTGAVAQAFSA
jgi:hypothetical protein